MADVAAWLSSLISDVGAVAGTVHRLQGEQLELVASVNIPEKVQAITRVIPKGKGMAGLAWERVAPVQTCNLKDDQTGDVRPGAKAVDAAAAVALPLTDANGAVWAVVGVAFKETRELPEAEIERIRKLASTLPAN
jgi:L-methionine (R)-S-oxide reductase